MGSLVLLLVRKFGIGQGFAKFLAWALLAFVIGLFLFIAKCTYDANVIEEHEGKVTKEIQQTDTKAKEQASERRAEDELKIEKAQRSRNDEIAKATAGKPSDAAIRLGCERLRQAGRDTSRIASCAGLGGGDETSPN